MCLEVQRVIFFPTCCTFQVAVRVTRPPGGFVSTPLHHSLWQSYTEHAATQRRTHDGGAESLGIPRGRFTVRMRSPRCCTRIKRYPRKMSGSIFRYTHSRRALESIKYRFRRIKHLDMLGITSNCFYSFGKSVCERKFHISLQYDLIPDQRSSSHTSTVFLCQKQSSHHCLEGRGGEAGAVSTGTQIWGMIE